MTRTIAEEVGQFAGSTPFVGHNIQGHSVNVKLVREVPEQVLRTSITHFGTRGMFGKPKRRSSQHDQDNVRRKRWRDTESLKRKAKPEPEDRGHQGAFNDNAGAPPTNSDYPGPANTAALDAPHPLPSPPSNIVTTSSLPIHAAQTRPQTSVRLSYEESPSTATPPTTTSRGAFPTFANHHNHIPSPANRSGDAATSVPLSSHYNAPANMGDVYLDTRYSPPVSTFAEHSASAIESPLPMETIDRRGGVDASMSVPAFIRQGNSVIDIATWTETAYKILRDRLAVDAMVNTRIPEIVHNTGDVLHEKPSYWPPSSPLGVARSEHPLALSPRHNGGSGHVYESVLGCHDARGEALGNLTWYGYSAASAAFAHTSYTANKSPHSSVPSSPPSEVFPRQTYIPVVNGYSMPMCSSAMHENENWGSSLAPNACGAYSASPSLAPEFSQYQYLHNDASARTSTFPSDELANGLVDPTTGYINATSLPNEAAGTSGLTGPPMNAPQPVFQVVPVLHLAPSRGIDAMNIEIDTHTSGLYSLSVASDAHYMQSFDRSSCMSSPTWLSQIPRMDRLLAGCEKEQRGHDAPSSHFRASLCTPSQG